MLIGGDKEMHKTVCKPFKETGHCKYGDSCKYIHERCVNSQEVSISTEKDARFKCGMCGECPDEMVATECDHKFCSFCAIKKYQELDECGVCKKPTYGRFWVV